MSKRKTLAASAVASLVTLGVVASSTFAQSGPAPQPNFAFEKCYGVAKAGKNDCATSSNSCAGHVKTDARGDAWIYLPKGSCEKLISGSTTPKV